MQPDAPTPGIRYVTRGVLVIHGPFLKGVAFLKLQPQNNQAWKRRDGIIEGRDHEIMRQLSSFVLSQLCYDVEA